MSMGLPRWSTDQQYVSSMVISFWSVSHTASLTTPSTELFWGYSILCWITQFCPFFPSIVLLMQCKKIESENHHICFYWPWNIFPAWELPRPAAVHVVAGVLRDSWNVKIFSSSTTQNILIISKIFLTFDNSRLKEMVSLLHKLECSGHGTSHGNRVLLCKYYFVSHQIFSDTKSYLSWCRISRLPRWGTEPRSRPC